MRRLAAGGWAFDARISLSQLLGKVVNVECMQDVSQDEEDPNVAPRVADLQSQLAKLDGPEDEAARFRLLREIYDLEHPTTDASEDWPEYIDVGGEL